MNLRKTLKRVLPPVLVEELRRYGAGITFAGDYGAWELAKHAATGYDANEIVRRVTHATRQVVAGNAAFERDAFLFAEHTYSYPVLATLMRSAALNQGQLRVIDYGGSLGSTFRQCRPFLQGLAQIRWCVVEQAHFVEVGKREFTTDELSFVGSLAEVPKWGETAVVLLSSVLQYLEEPQKLLQNLGHYGATSLMIDRTPMSARDRDCLCVQSVPKHIYSASYPCWIFSSSRLKSLLAQEWSLLAEFDSGEGDFFTKNRSRFKFGGLIYEKKSAS